MLLTFCPAPSHSICSVFFCFTYPIVYLLPKEPVHPILFSVNPFMNMEKITCNSNFNSSNFDFYLSDSPPPFPLLPETSLLNLIEPNQLAYNAVTDITSSILDVAKVQLDNPASEPIKIPIERKVDRTPSPTSSLDSFVFVENRPLFAAEEENDVESFFNGPSPSFTNSGDVLEEINEISNQLAAIESNAHQWDSFVDSVCSPDAEEDDEEEAKTMT